MSELLLLDLKPECSGCPLQVEAQHELLLLCLSKHFALHAGESMVGEAGEQFDEFLASQVPTEQLDEVKQAIRKAAGDRLEDIDDKITEVRATSQQLTDSCNGRLRMRASRAGVSYTVSICTSSTIGEDVEFDDGKALTAHIIATPEKE